MIRRLPVVRWLGILRVRGWHLLHQPSRPSTECFRNDMRQLPTDLQNSPLLLLWRVLPGQDKVTPPHPRSRSHPTSRPIPAPSAPPRRTLLLQQQQHRHHRTHILTGRTPSVHQCRVVRPSCWIGRTRRDRRDRMRERCMAKVQGPGPGQRGWGWGWV